MIFIPIIGFIFIFGSFLVPIIAVGGTLEAGFYMLHLGPLFSTTLNAARELSSFVQKVFPIESLIRILLYLFASGIVIHLIGLHRKVAKVRNKVYFALGVFISFVWLMIIATPTPPGRWATFIEIIAMFSGFLIFLFIISYSFYRFLKFVWNLLGINPQIRNLRDSSEVQNAVATIFTGLVLYKWYQLYKSGFYNAVSGFAMVCGALIFFAVGYVFVWLFVEFISNFNNFLRKLINKI